MFRFSLLILVGFSVSLLSFSQSAWAEKGRVALVIGNSAYKHTSPLDNPKNDATVMAKVLGELGFEVISSLDLSQNDMKRAIKTFAQKLEAGGRGTVGLFYYAGHGVQVGGRN
ncbi:MAG: caspase family protein, partial [Rhizobiales bacterium]|nr:caspase family protein [Hyphomicrobiales bacterium]